MADYFKEEREWSCLSKQELETIRLFTESSGEEIKEVVGKILTNNFLSNDQLFKAWDILTLIIEDNLGVDLAPPESSTEIKEAMLRIASQKIPI